MRDDEGLGKLSFSILGRGPSLRGSSSFGNAALSSSVAGASSALRLSTMYIVRKNKSANTENCAWRGGWRGGRASRELAGVRGVGGGGVMRAAAVAGLVG